MTDDLKARVLSNIPNGKAHPIKGNKLAIMCNQAHMDKDYNLKGETRGIRLIIEELIDDGETICSSPGRKADPKTNTPKQEAGYFNANNPQEVKEALIVLRSYGKKLFRHYYALKKAGQRKFSGQLTLKL